MLAICVPKTMASASFHLTAAFSPPRPKIPSLSPTLHFSIPPSREVSILGLRRQKSQKVAGASTPGKDSVEKKAGVGSTETSVSSSPPLATILAGIVVFLLFLAALGSILMWIVGLIVKPPSA